jgi:hypothetical protein
MGAGELLHDGIFDFNGFDSFIEGREVTAPIVDITDVSTNLIVDDG